jgi:hypothetical protein
MATIGSSKGVESVGSSSSPASSSALPSNSTSLTKSSKGNVGSFV